MISTLISWEELQISEFGLSGPAKWAGLLMEKDTLQIIQSGFQTTIHICIISKIWKNLYSDLTSAESVNSFKHIRLRTISLMNITEFPKLQMKHNSTVTFFIDIENAFLHFSFKKTLWKQGHTFDAIPAISNWGCFHAYGGPQLPRTNTKRIAQIQNESHKYKTESHKQRNIHTNMKRMAQI